MQFSPHRRWSSYYLPSFPATAGCDTGLSGLKGGLPPSHQRATGGQRHQENNDPMECEAVPGETPPEHIEPSRERARVGARGGETALAENETANGGLGSFAQPRISRGSTLERRQQGDWSLGVSNGSSADATGCGIGLSELENPGYEDACRGTSSFARRKLRGCCALVGGRGAQKRGKVFSPATTGSDTGLPRLEHTVSRRSSCIGELCS